MASSSSSSEFALVLPDARVVPLPHIRASSTLFDVFAAVYKETQIPQQHQILSLNSADAAPLDNELAMCQLSVLGIAPGARFYLRAAGGPATAATGASPGDAESAALAAALAASMPDSMDGASSSSAVSSSVPPASSPIVTLDAASLPAGSAQPLGEGVLSTVNRYLFGDAPNADDVARWHQQGFQFNRDPEAPEVGFGLQQLHGGPCGVLAPVQAYVLLDLLYSRHRIAAEQVNELADTGPLAPTPEQCAAALARALCHILVRCLAPPGEPDADAEPLVARDYTDYATQGPILLVGRDAAGAYTVTHYAAARDVEAFVRARLGEADNMFASGTGVLLFVYSCLLSRSLQRVVHGDMDDPTTPLVARFGHCSQELVNLMVCGSAVSNIHDGSKDLGMGMLLKGVPQRSEVGFLTVLEAMHYGNVGDYYKRCAFPIWVVGSTSHYTVLFGLRDSITRTSPAEARDLRVTRAFQELDPEESGFLQLSSLGELLTKAGISEPAGNMRRLVDPDGMGYILLGNFKQAVAHLENGGTTNWTCERCTFENEATAATCDMCNAKVPAVKLKRDPDAAAGSSSAAPSAAFTLFHYNGIAPACVSRVAVELLDIPQQGQALKPGLREVITTRWPNSLVEFEGGVEPKIV